jgi:hypothetical protein
MQSVSVSSGAKVEIGVAAFKDVMAFKSAAMRELSEAGVDLKGLRLDKDADISGLLSALLRVVSSDAVYEKLWPCLARSTYNGQKITEATFEDENARQDFYEVCGHFLKVNITPFLPKAASAWLASAAATFTAPPASASTTNPPSSL